MSIINQLQTKAKLLPSKAGCYLMKNADNDIIYIGKSSNLKSRVMSYFNLSAKNKKTYALVSHIRDFSFILTKTNNEAFILENNLIKKYIPKYNILMKDDKTYPYIIIDWNEDFPRLIYTRKIPAKKNIEVIGPFAHGSHVAKIIDIFNKAYKLRDCNNREFKIRKGDPCLLFQMNQCSAACNNLITSDSYKIKLKKIILLLKENSNLFINELEHKMHKAADLEMFEQAAFLRDNIYLLKEFSFFKNQQVEILNSSKNLNVDFWNFHVGSSEVEWGFYLARHGKIIGEKSFYFHKTLSDLDIDEQISNLIFQYYLENGQTLPTTIRLDISSEYKKILTASLKQVFGIKFLKYKKNEIFYRSLVGDFLKEKQRVRMNSSVLEIEGLNVLRNYLHLKETPRLLECYDIAVFQGSSPTGSQVVFKDGKTLKKRYRYYNLTELPEGNNDFKMLEEVFRRRLKYPLLPDVFVVDGGKQQMNVFSKVLQEYKLDIPVVGIAKSRFLKEKRSEERLFYLDFPPFELKQHRGLQKIITSMRDEAHRFCRKLHHKKESERLFGD